MTLNEFVARAMYANLVAMNDSRDGLLRWEALADEDRGHWLSLASAARQAICQRIAEDQSPV